MMVMMMVIVMMKEGDDVGEFDGHASDCYLRQ
jgi:hypothetical protein